MSSTRRLRWRRRARSGDGPSATGPARLSVQDVSVHFGGVVALDGVTFGAEPGSIVGLIGANGSGKTTTLDVISGLVGPRAGSVRVDDVDLGEYLPEERLARRRGALVPGLPALPGADRARRAPALRGRPVRGGGAADHAPPALGAPRRAPQARSRGPGDRRLRARAVPRPPDRGALDRDAPGGGPRLHRAGPSPAPAAGRADRRDRPAGSRSLRPLLRRLHQVSDTTIVLVEHDVPLVFELCSQVIVMELGRVVASGTPEQVRADPKALAAYLGASDEALMASGPVAGGRGDAGHGSKGAG